MSNKTTKQQAGRKGGLATMAKHGREHMQKIGKRGALTFWQRYKLDPVGGSDFAIVDKQTGEIKNFLSGGLPWRSS